MKTTLLLTAMSIVAFIASAQAQAPKAKDAQVRKLDLSQVKQNPRDAEQGDPKKPLVITDVEGLNGAFADKDSRAVLAKQVDFTKEKLVYFHWAGSGGDRLTPQVVDTNEGAMVEFRYKGGLTDDLRRHFHVFAIPRGAKWKVE